MRCYCCNNLCKTWEYKLNKPMCRTCLEVSYDNVRLYVPPTEEGDTFKAGKAHSGPGWAFCDLDLTLEKELEALGYTPSRHSTIGLRGLIKRQHRKDHK